MSDDRRQHDRRRGDVGPRLREIGRHLDRLQDERARRVAAGPRWGRVVAAIDDEIGRVEAEAARLLEGSP